MSGWTLVKAFLATSERSAADTTMRTMSPLGEIGVTRVASLPLLSIRVRFKHGRIGSSPGTTVRNLRDGGDVPR